MNWFERHLHWTAIITSLGGGVAAFIAQMVTAQMLGAYDPWITKTTIETTGIVVGAAVLCLGWGWVLVQKERSLWWLPLLLFVPFGWIAIFTLKNKSQFLQEG